MLSWNGESYIWQTSAVELHSAQSTAVPKYKFTDDGPSFFFFNSLAVHWEKNLKLNIFSEACGHFKHEEKPLFKDSGALCTLCALQQKISKIVLMLNPTFKSRRTEAFVMSFGCKTTCFSMEDFVQGTSIVLTSVTENDRWWGERSVGVSHGRSQNVSVFRDRGKDDGQQHVLCFFFFFFHYFCGCVCGRERETGRKWGVLFGNPYSMALLSDPDLNLLLLIQVKLLLSSSLVSYPPTPFCTCV